MKKRAFKCLDCNGETVLPSRAGGLFLSGHKAKQSVKLWDTPPAAGPFPSLLFNKSVMDGSVRWAQP